MFFAAGTTGGAAGSGMIRDVLELSITRIVHSARMYVYNYTR